MAKDKEKKLAHILYVEQGKDACEISPLIKVSEATLSKWVREGGWKEERDARNSSPHLSVGNIKKIMGSLGEERLKLNKDLREAENNANAEAATDIRKQISRVDDAISKWNKALGAMDKESRVSLSSYLWVMEEIFQALRQFDIDLYMKTLDFQERHIQQMCTKK
jgi:transposase-like protein